MSKATVEQTKMGTEAIAFCIARTLIERDPSLKAPMRANLRKMWELLEERDDHAAADMVAAFRYVFAASAVMLALSALFLALMEERVLAGPAKDKPSLVSE